MTAGTRCPACGLMQMPGPTCKSCGRALGGPPQPPGPPHNAGMEVATKASNPHMRKVLVLLGAALLVAIGWGIVGFGLFKVWSYSSALEKGSKSYVDEVVPRIVSSWNAAELMERAGPELLEAASPEKVEKIFRAFSDRLGPLKHYEGSQGQARTLITPQTGKVTTASYVADASFEKGKASIQLNLVMRDGRWQIVGFYVNSDALIP